jgi:hypothetical protein
MGHLSNTLNSCDILLIFLSWNNVTKCHMGVCGGGRGFKQAKNYTYYLNGFLLVSDQMQEKKIDSYKSNLIIFLLIFLLEFV